MAKASSTPAGYRTGPGLKRHVIVFA